MSGSWFEGDAVFFIQRVRSVSLVALRERAMHGAEMSIARASAIDPPRDRARSLRTRAKN